MPGEPLLLAEGLSRGFGERESRLELFSGLSLALDAGEAVAIVGPSGCGKSTLLHILAGLDRPDAGRVVVDGRDWEALAPEAKARWRGEAIGFVFQLHHLLPELTAEENVALPLFLAGTADGAARAAARELLARVGLERRAATLPRVLSGGERQRVAIARAVARRPRLLLCDEPTGSLDAAHAAGVLDLLLGEARERAGALLLVTHDPGVAARCGTVLTLSPDGLSAA